MSYANSDLAGLREYFKEKIEYLYLKRKRDFLKKLGEDYGHVDHELKKYRRRPKIIFFFGAGASHSAGVWHSTSSINKAALDALGSLENVRKFLSEEELSKIGLSNSDLEKPDELVFEQIMSLLRRYFGEWPECAEVLLFQKSFAREHIVNLQRDIVPTPFIYEITAHMVKYGLLDHVITTNFDELLDRSLAEELGKKGYVRVHHLSKYESVWMDRVYETKPCLVKVHGTISYSLTLRQLVDNVTKFERPKVRLLENILEDAVVVLVGHALYNPNLQELFYRLKTKGVVKDIFVVKRRPRSPARFIEFLVKEDPENLLLMDCEDFAKKLADAIEEIQINTSSAGNAGDQHDVSLDNATKFFPDFSRHRLRNVFFNELGTYPCSSTIYLIEFIGALFKARGLVTDHALMECPHMIRALKHRPEHLLSIEETLEYIRRKKIRLENNVSNDSEAGQNLDDDLEPFKDKISNYCERVKYYIPYMPKLFKYYELLKTIKAEINKNIKIISESKFDVGKGDILKYKLSDFIRLIEALKNQLRIEFEDLGDKVELRQQIDKILYKLYSIYEKQLCHLIKIEKKGPEFLLKQFIGDDNPHVPISHVNLFKVIPENREEDCCKKDCKSMPYSLSNVEYFEYLYCLTYKSVIYKNIREIIYKKIREIEEEIECKIAKLNKKIQQIRKEVVIIGTKIKELECKSKKSKKQIIQKYRCIREKIKSIELLCKVLKKHILNIEEIEYKIAKLNKKIQQIRKEVVIIGTKIKELECKSKKSKKQIIQKYRCIREKIKSIELLYQIIKKDIIEIEKNIKKKDLILEKKHKLIHGKIEVIEREIRKNVINNIISVLLQNKLLGFDSLNTIIYEKIESSDILNKESNDHGAFREIDNILKQLMVNFDIDVKPYHNLMPILPCSIDLGSNYTHCKDNINKEESDRKIIFLKSKFDLEIANNYLASRLLKNYENKPKIYIFSETGEWIVKENNIESLKSCEIYIQKSAYTGLIKYFNDDIKLYHAARMEYLMECLGKKQQEEFDLEFKDICCHKNDLHGTILVHDSHIYGILFKRNMKSTIISPVFFKIRASISHDEKNWLPLDKLAGLLRCLATGR